MSEISMIAFLLVLIVILLSLAKYMSSATGSRISKRANIKSTHSVDFKRRIVIVEINGIDYVIMYGQGNDFLLDKYKSIPIPCLTNKQIGQKNFSTTISHIIQLLLRVYANLAEKIKHLRNAKQDSKNFKLALKEAESKYKYDNKN